jgi:hypothetical protein
VSQAVYRPTEHHGFTTIECLPFLVGRQWDDHAMAFVHAIRPSSVRTTRGEVTCDARPWRVTVYLDASGVIERLEQEVQVGLTEDWRYGADASAWAFGGNRYETRATLNVLGKRALALVIANEWAGERELATSLCVECCARESEGHSPGCEWGAVVAAAKALQGGR